MLDVPDRQVGPRSRPERAGLVVAGGPVPTAGCGVEGGPTRERSLGACRTASRTVAQPASGVTGASVPKASDAGPVQAAKGFIAGPAAAEPGLVELPGRPQAASKAGCTLATTPRSANVAMPASDHLHMLQPMPRGADRWSAETAAARRSPATAAATASSPMQWNPAWSPARVQAIRCSAISWSLR